MDTLQNSLVASEKCLFVCLQESQLAIVKVIRRTLAASEESSVCESTDLARANEQKRRSMVRTS